MPLHDLLEGRYPPTATLQNQHSDDAAAEWMRNATHLRYSQRWLKHALHEFAPYHNGVIGIALDDDQGAYLDNQTWPAPHLTQYLNLLGSYVHAAGWKDVPLYINTYQMKVTASSPVWAMGNWYQSDAFSIGEHDRAQLEFTLGLLATRPHQPVMLSEFQAGWLQGPEDVRPRPADPVNTSLALTTALGMDARGVVLFPAQDTLNPAGMEVPFANFFYAWDAALPLNSSSNHSGDPWTWAPPPRYGPTEAFGRFIRRFGPDLAASHPHWDAQIGYITSALDERRLTPADVNAVADATIELQRGCRTYALACRVVDLRYATLADLHRAKILFVPGLPQRPIASVLAKVRAFRQEGGLLVATKAIDDETVDAALQRTFTTRTVDYGPGAIFSQSAKGAPELGFLTVPNYSDKPQDIKRASIHLSLMTKVDLPDLHIPERSVLVTPIDLDLRSIAPSLRKPVTLVGTDCQFFTEDFALYNKPGVVVDPPKELDAALLLQTPRQCTVRLTTPTGEQTIALPQQTPSDFKGGAPGDLPRADQQLTGIVIGRDGTVRLGAREPFPLFRPGSMCSTCIIDFARHLDRIPLRSSDVSIPASPAIEAAVAPGRSEVRVADVYRDGSRAVVFQNARVRLVISAAAGARAFAFQDLERKQTPPSIFTTVGGIRDDVAIEPPLSTSDRIAKYTHDFPAGMFNRLYDVQILSSGTSAAVRFTYDAPDVSRTALAFNERDARARRAILFSRRTRRLSWAPGDRLAARRVGHVDRPRRIANRVSPCPSRRERQVADALEWFCDRPCRRFRHRSHRLARGRRRASTGSRRAQLVGRTPDARTGPDRTPAVRVSATKRRPQSRPHLVPEELARLEALAQGQTPTPANRPH